MPSLSNIAQPTEAGRQSAWLDGLGDHRVRERLTQWLFLAPAVAYLLLFFGYPAVTNTVMSLQHVTTVTFQTGEAPFVGLQNYISVVRSPLFAKAMWNTAFFTIGSIVGQFGLGLAFAVFFNRSFPLSGVMRSLLLLPWLLPAIASSSVWRWILDLDSGALNQILVSLHLGRLPWLTSPSLALVTVTLVNIWIGVPFNLAILYGGLKGIPRELYEAAALDGAHGWQQFRYVTWPMLRSVVVVVLVLGVVYTLKTLDIILGLTNGGPANATQSLATRAYQVSFIEFDFGKGAAWGNILVLVALAFALLYLRTSQRAKTS
jgi:multiple sugar transport system permease protein